MLIRELRHSDREFLKDMIFRTENFSQAEKDIALELIDIALNNPEQKDYHFRIAEENNKPVGYYCAGRRALTKGVFDLYWIVTDPDFTGKGIGSVLLRDAEDYIKTNGGNLIWVETSSRDDYELTRKFYLKNNYSEIAFIKNFYKDNDSLIVYGKYFTT